MKNRTQKTLATISLGLVGALALAGCSASSADETDSKGTVTLGFLPSWTDALSMTYLLKDQFEKRGYTVELESLTEAGPLYTGIARGDIDMYPSAWSDVAQVSYMEQYADDLEDLGSYYDEGTGVLAVPSYMDDINKISDLRDHADLFDGKIYTIEPGSGTVDYAERELLPHYGLDENYDLITSSTPAMLGQLDGAIADKENIVVTLWKPFWAISAYDIKLLEDDEQGYEVEGLHFVANKEFSKKYPELAEMVGEIKLDDEQYGSLEDLVVNEYGEGKEAEAVDAWLEEHSDEFDWVVD